MTQHIEDILPLSPMQQGMLFHSLYAPDSGVYVEQTTCTLRGPLDLAAFRRAWQQALARHAALRAAFVWEEVDEPLQVIQRQVELPLTVEDWRELPADEQAARLEALLADERRNGFDLAEAPLLRLTLLRISDNAHRLVWTHHHLLLDGWSVPLLLGEVFAAYEALRQNQPLRLPPARPYRDYIAWLVAQDSEAAERFWRGELAGLRSPTPLVVDRTTAVGDAQGEAKTQLSAETTAALHTLARQQRLTLNTLVQGAWALLLSRYSGEAEVCFGTTVSGRPADLNGAEGMIGLFINTLPLRLPTPADAPLAEWLREVQRRATTLRQFEHSPLVQIQGWSELPPSTPLFESILVFENYPIDERLREHQGSLRIEEVGGAAHTNYPLTLVASPGQRLTLDLLYDGGRFDGATIERMLGHLATLLASFAGNLSTPVSRLPLLTEAETQQIAAWNDTARPVDMRPPHRRFEEIAQRNPNAAAIADCRLQIADWPGSNAETQNAEWRIENEEISNASGLFSTLNSQFSIFSYAELNQRANQLAHHLRGLGVGRESIVGICLERSPELVIALLAVWKAGAAYLPLDPNYPAERLAYMIEDAQPVVILTINDLRFTIGKERVEQVIVNRQSSIVNLHDWQPFAQLPVENLNLEVAPEQLAYIIYTSGSTGRPKGVLVEHGGLANLTGVLLEWFAITPERRVLQFASFNFDASVTEFVMALAGGATLVLADQETLSSPPALQRLLREQAISTATLPPTLLALLEPAELPALHTVVAAGERCPLTVAEQWANGRRLLNGYGPTEATVASSYYHVELEQLPAGVSSVPTGRPIANTQLHILDAYGQPVPMGVPGELHISGAGLARGYLNRPELTAERFINLRLTIDDVRLEGRAPDQSSIVNRQSSIYKSGDLARYLPDGSIEILGRMDDQVKLRGVRIELGEIEAVLRQHPAVADVAVVLREERLVAYVVTVTGDRGRETEAAPLDSFLPRSPVSGLPSFLRERLPSAYLPSAFVELDALPLTPNGKVDRKALPVPEAAVTGEASDGPRTLEEELIAGAMAQVLRLERVGREGHFFALGGHSLLATQLVARLREAFQLELPLRAVFEAPTVAELARRVVELRRNAAGSAQPAIQLADRSGPLPVSFAQQRLWFLDQLEPDSPFYNNPVALRLHGTLDVAALEAALQALVQRHESLRTSFTSVAGTPVQVIAPAAPLSIPLTDLRHVAEDEREAEARRLAIAEARTPFNLATGPLLRAALLRLADDEHIALLTMHHIVSDGWSMGVLVREIAALYAGQTLPPLPVQYADYAVWQRDWLTSATLDGQLSYWRETLAGVPELLDLPPDRPRPPVQTTNGANYSFALPASLNESLASFCREEGVTPFMTLLAAFQALLYRYSGQETVCVGTPIAGRSRPELEGLIGFFINTLVLRADFAPELSGRALLAQVKERALAAYAHQDVPFEMVVEALQPTRNLSHGPLFQVMLVLNNMPVSELQLPGLRLSPVAGDEGIARFDLTLQLQETPAGLHATLEYNTDLFDASTVERMMGHYQRLLAGLVATPDAPLLALPLLSEAEAQQIATWSRPPAVPFPADLCIHQLIEQVAARVPTAVAVTGDGRPATGATQQADSAERPQNQLAHHLRSLGVGPEAIVGLALPRSPELIIAALAVWKAGAAFLPLDLSYPAERLRYMIEDAQPAVLLTLLTEDERPGTGAAPTLPQPSRMQGGADLLTSVPSTSLRTGSGRPSSVNLSDWSPFAHLPTSNPDVAVSPEQLAYVIYTSGSTGKPKGTLLAHQGLVNLACWQRDFFGLGAGSRVLQFSALSFDAFVWELAMALASGAALVLADQATLASPPELRRLMQREQVSIATLPPSLLALLSPDELPDLHTVVAAGEASSVALVQRWSAGRRFVNAYGPTETTVCATAHVCDPLATTPPPIGWAIANTELHVLDTTGQPVPIGVPGELHIGGVGVARGYLHRPAKIQHPTSTIYKTGDLARWRPDGTLHFLGRVDQQVKLRGFRIELGEIEAALRQHPTVADALVLARGMGVSQRLVAYIVVQNGPPQPPRTQGGAEPADTTENGSWFPSAALGAGPVLGSFLRDKLPAYMLPSAIVELERWPLTPSGKIDRAALPEADAQPSQRAAYVAPRTETEATLAALAAEVLGLAQVGVEDNFFALGGHSLLATQLLARVQAATGVAVSLRALFETPTVAGLALAVEAQAGDNAEAERIAALLAQVENLSEEEVQALLAQQ